MKSRSPGFHRSDLPTGNPQSKSDGAIIEQRPFTVNDTLASPEKRPPRLPLRESPRGSCHRDGTFGILTGDIGMPDRSSALTRHDAEFSLRLAQGSSSPAVCQEMKRPLSGFVSRQSLRAVHLRTSALTYCRSVSSVVKLNSDSSKTQPPPFRATGGLFPHVADESETNIVAGRNLSSSVRASAGGNA
jgi:hypothetical protein